MTDQVEFKVGDRVRTSSGILGIITDTDHEGAMIDSNGQSFYFYDKDLKEIEEPQKQELKLEVGKKYNFEPRGKKCLLKFIWQENNECFFISTDHCIFSWPKEELISRNITEHRELIKNEVVGWVLYKNDAPDKDITSQLIGKSASNVVRKNKSELFPLPGAKPIYGKWTFEQLPEPEEE